MSFSRPPPSHSPPDVPGNATQENEEACEETMNDEIHRQIYRMQISGVTPFQTFNSTTRRATDTYVTNATDMYNSGVPYDSSVESTTYSHEINLASAQAQSQQQMQAQASHAVPWNLDDVSNDLASLAASSYQIYQQSQQDYYDPQCVFWQETVIPDGGMFPIDIVVPMHSGSINDTMQLHSGSELATGMGASPSTLQQEQSLYAGTTEPMGGETLVPSTARYDDDDIPRNDPSWLLKPQKHPWVQSGRAYLCPFAPCQITIVQRKNKLRHNTIFHRGV